MAEPVVISLRVQDSEGNFTSIPIHYDSADVNTVAEAQATMIALAPLLFGNNAPSGAGIQGASVSFPLDIGPLALSKASALVPAAQSRNDAGATLSFRNANGKAHSVYIPAFKTAYLSGGKVQSTDADVEPLIDAFVDGIGGHQPTDDNGLDLTAFRTGNQSVRKS